MVEWNDRLREIMEERGVSQRELAKLLEATDASISLYVAGRRHPPLQTLQTICRVLSISADWLLFGDTGKASSPQQTFTDEAIRVALESSQLSDQHRKYIQAAITYFKTQETKIG